MTIKEFYEELKMVHAENYEVFITTGFDELLNFSNIEEIDYEIDDKEKKVKIYA